MTTTYTTRIVSAETEPTVGQITCLVEWKNLLPAHGTPPWERKGNLLTDNPRTNQGGQPEWDGWLGATNDVSEHARGAWRVVSVQVWDRDFDSYSDGSLYRVRLSSAAIPDA